MNAIMNQRGLKTVLLSCLVGYCLNGKAALYSFSNGSSGSPVGVVAPGSSSSFPLSSVQDLSAQGMLTSISSLELQLTFNDGGALASDGSGIQGLLTLGTGSGSPYVAFNPVATTTSGGNSIYDITYSTAPSSGFNGLNPNDTWSLLLWDNNSSIGNELVSWNLDITAVPEPVNVALGLFGVVLATVGGIKWLRRQNKPAAV